MAVIVFVANGPLQQIVQPVVYGARLRLNPLVVLSMTIAAGTLLGIPGMVLWHLSYPPRFVSTTICDS